MNYKSNYIYLFCKVYDDKLDVMRVEVESFYNMKVGVME